MLQTPNPPEAPSLEALEQEARRQIEILRYPAEPWVGIGSDEAAGDILDVLIVGGGQSGLAVSFALQRMCIDNTLVIDTEEDGDEGPWIRFARMKTLRTPKHLTGIDNGVPALSPEAWFTAKFGPDAWENLDKIPRTDWADYLGWFKRVARIRTSSKTELLSFATDPERPDTIKAIVSTPAGEKTLHCRRLVFATGIDGSGCWHVPEHIAAALPPEAYSHTSEAIDFDAIKGKRIGVLGAGASAFDNGGVALETGVEEMRLFYRRPRLPRVNPFRWMENRGFLEFYADLDDAAKWNFFEQVLRNNQPPPQDTFDRCAQHDHFHLHPGEPWETVTWDNGEVVVTTPKGTYRFDHVIIGTGLIYDLTKRPEIAQYADKIASWGDRFQPTGDCLENETMSTMPYLGEHFEYLERDPGTLDWAGKVYNFTFGAGLSLGIASAALSGLRFGVDRLTKGIGQSLFAEEAAQQLENLRNFDDPELVIDEKF